MQIRGLFASKRRSTGKVKASAGLVVIIKCGRYGKRNIRLRLDHEQCEAIRTCPTYLQILYSAWDKAQEPENYRNCGEYI